MADRFDKFTERARRVLTSSQEEAQRFSHDFIGTEHLLLGLLRQEDCVAVKVLSRFELTPTKVRTSVEFIIGRGEKRIKGEIGLTPRAKKVIELSVEEARRLNLSYIGTEHLLLGLMREGEGIAFGVLESLGVSLDRARTETARVLSQSLPQMSASGRPAELSQGPLRIAPNTQLREFALRMLNQAMTSLDDVQDSELGNELLAAFVKAEIDTILEMLDLSTGTRQELDDSWNRVTHSANQLTTAENVLRKHHPVVSEALSVACSAVHRAISTPPAPGFRRPSA